ncbi:MAG: transglycosylase SLT domain-containing protein [Candidatus Kapabacteria bacterium]|nr:transglycosylase SLT domain-containing protein [Candidatus Kapabacteria bacterium]
MANSYSTEYNQNVIKTVAEANGFDPCVLLAMASIESNFNNAAYNSGGYAGLFQLSDGYSGLTGDDRFDPKLNTQATIQGMKRNRKYVENAGIAFEPWMYYLAHQQGAKGFTDILANYNTPIDQAPHSANMLNQAKSITKGRSCYPYRTAGDFLECWKSVFNEKYEKYCGTMVDDGTGTFAVVLIGTAIFAIMKYYFKLF